MLITDSHTLQNFCQKLTDSSLLFIDTEFVRDRTYYPLLCLVQIAGVQGEAAAVDVLQPGINITPLLELIYNPKVIKILHAGRQDLEIFYHIRGDVPQPLFDTQIAAMILGLGEQIGYEALVRYCLKKQICKAQQFTDWSKRPLSEEQIRYALDDVLFLRECYPVLIDQLKETGRLAWVEEETRYLYNLALYMNKPEEMWQRIRKRDTRPHYLARLQILAAWREKQAMMRNLPRSKILHDDALQEIALTNPKTEKALQRVRYLQSNAPFDILLKLLAEANAKPIAECPAVEKNILPDPALDMLRDMLKLLLKIKAKEHNMTPSLLCSKECMESMLAGMPVEEVLSGWRYDMFGRDAAAMLTGNLSFRMKGKNIEVVRN